jgi:polyisoprenoid-binding protein YceI
VLPALSRVGFDAKTTLHDFSGVTSAVAGELECALGAPGEHPRGRIVVEAAQLGSGDAERDEAMREHLGVGAHATLEFVLTGFEPHAVDAGELRVAGTATGTMTIRGVTQAVSMPVELAVDDARRLSVEGEMTLDLETFGVPVPSKLGLITMEKDVKVWLALKLRANSRSEG